MMESKLQKFIDTLESDALKRIYRDVNSLVISLPDSEVEFQIAVRLKDVFKSYAAREV